jgi:hypothetical protein
VSLLSSVCIQLTRPVVEDVALVAPGGTTKDRTGIALTSSSIDRAYMAKDSCKSGRSLGGGIFDTCSFDCC